VDGQGRVLHMNRTAEAFTAADGPCRVVQGHLNFVATTEQARFAALAAAACAQAAASRKAVVRLPAAGAFRVVAAVPALAVSVIPLKASHPLAAFRQRHLALVVFSGAGTASVGVDTLVARELWGLTATEARLVLALVAGQPLKAFAEAEGCSWHTVRTHLRNILRKSGCRRQVDLVQVVQSLVPGVG
jgi:DNA-binding CsgD family transcriptional regulator